MIHPIYRRFFEVLRHGDRDELERSYLRPNEAFFRPYVAFMSQGEQRWEEFSSDFAERWCGSPEEVRAFRSRLEGHDAEALVARGVREAERVIGPEAAEVDVYLCVGLE